LLPILLLVTAFLASPKIREQQTDAQQDHAQRAQEFVRLLPTMKPYVDT